MFMLSQSIIKHIFEADDFDEEWQGGVVDVDTLSSIDLGQYGSNLCSGGGLSS